MSLKHNGRWHYEHVPTRGPANAWRVADEDDDYVCDFPSEDEARECVREHNKTLDDDMPEEWKF